MIFFCKKFILGLGEKDPQVLLNMLSRVVVWSCGLPIFLTGQNVYEIKNNTNYLKIIKIGNRVAQLNNSTKASAVGRDLLIL
jgi:hypothetical protein